MPGLQPCPGDPVGARRGSPLFPCLLLFPEGPQVVVVLQQLPDHLAALLAEEIFQLEGREPGRGEAGEPGGQRVEHGFRDGERVIRRDRGIRCHEGSSFLRSGLASTSEPRKKSPLLSGFR